MAPHLFYLTPTLVKISPHLLLAVIPETNVIQQQQQVLLRALLILLDF